MKTLTADSYYTWYGNGVIGHNAYYAGVRIVSIVKRSADYRIKLHNNTCINIANEAEIQVSNKNNFIIR